MRRTAFVRALVVCIAALFLAAIPAAAQTSNAPFVGAIAEPTGAAIPGANVTVTNQATGLNRTVQTNELGQYRVYPFNPATHWDSASATEPTRLPSHQDGFGGRFEEVNQ